MLRLQNIRVYENADEGKILEAALRKYRIKADDVISWKITRKSIDARNKADIHFLYTLDVKVISERKYPKIPKSEPVRYPEIQKKRTSNHSPVIIGAGPAGLFCALTLIENGYRPIIIERGKSVEERRRDVEMYRSTGVLDTESNVQFGEGGAGCFSDGKLTTGINSPFVQKVLGSFHRFGAPEEITYLAHPHIGTDNLYDILINIRKYIEDNGGRYYFNTCFTGFKKTGDLIKVNCGDINFITDTLVLALGHSARDTFEMLRENNLEMKRKNFSVGVRIEHLQEMINRAQYGDMTELELPAAEYRLVYHGQDRVCYSFCMCPGGEVIASSNETGGIVTNGMSNFARDGENANSALLVNVNTDDLEGTDVMEGFRFQRKLEKKAFEMGGSNGCAPVQRFEDYCNNTPSERIGKVVPSYKPGYTLSNLNELFPEYVNETIKEGVRYFDSKIHGFADGDSILTGVETRTSSPVTIIRNSDLVSSIDGIYPCGEGAGYAGGITSAAVDGIKVAIKIIEKE